MSNKILHKRSLTTDSIPTTSSLSAGELAINVPDGKIYLLKSGSSTQSIESVIVSNTTSSIGTLTLSGSLILSGSTTINSGSVLEIASENLQFDFDFLSFSGSAEITGSLIVTTGITGSLSGTSSYALTASSTPNAITTASVSLNTITFTKGNGTTFPITVNTGSGGSGTPSPTIGLFNYYNFI